MDLGTISAYLLSLGFSPKHKGYLFLREAVKLCATPVCPGNLSSEIYPLIAQKFGTNIAAVEKNISNAISLAWLKGDLEKLQEEFGYTVDLSKGKPTTKQFIYSAVERLRMPLNMLRE